MLISFQKPIKLNIARNYLKLNNLPVFMTLIKHDTEYALVQIDPSLKWAYSISNEYSDGWVKLRTPLKDNQLKKCYYLKIKICDILENICAL